ncbi:DUF3606 domain-containing protein [Sphingopyxis sp.]|uniref:DUF3606 domain-containing protein n=1 Tax=Sphingopyxis sp. TaxID=1908224 RepID=UPI003BAA7311
MTDAQTSMRPLASDRIDLRDPVAIESWMAHLAVGEDELREAVDAVGTCPGHVRDYLGIRI